MSEGESDIVGTPLTGPRRAAFAFIFVTVLLDMLALGLIMPVLPRLIESFVGHNTADAARIFGLFATAWALMQFIFSPLLGALSDRFGRRPVVLLSNLGLAIDYVLMAFAPSLIWLFIGRVMSGATAASISTAFAYLADITAPEKRAGVFGKVGAAFGAGFIIGPAAGGLLGQIDLHLPFWVAAGLSFSNFLYGLFVLPESLPKARRSAFEWRKANPVGALSLLAARPGLLGLALMNFVAQLAHVVLPAVYVLFAAYRYGWNELTVGLSLAFVGLASIVTRWFVVGPVVVRFGERTSILAGYAFGITGFIILALVPNGYWAMIGVIPLSLWSIADPAVQGLMTRLVGANEQGRLQGANSSVQSIAQLAGPFLFTLSFAYFIGPSAPLLLPGAPFLLASALLLLALLIAVRVLAATKVNQPAGL